MPQVTSIAQMAGHKHGAVGWEQPKVEDVGLLEQYVESGMCQRMSMAQWNGAAMRRRIVDRALYHRHEDTQAMMHRALHRLHLPVLYPQNLLLWWHVRNTVMDVGRPYMLRINMYTGLFAAGTLFAALMFIGGLVAASAGSALFNRDEYIVLFT